MVLFLVLAVAAAVSFCLTGLLRRYALARQLIDIPNARSSHVIPTPRGGGVAIVVVFIAALLILGGLSLLPWQSIAGVVGAGGTVALIGFLDDHGHVAARWRLLGHFAAAIWALIWIGGLPPLVLFGETFDLAWLGHIGAAIYLVWMLNLYNFMDGIDGLASIQAISVCIGGALVYLLFGDVDMALLPLLLAAAVFGFLCWNFPPAKIFMGDAGSGFLGIVLGVLSLQAAWSNPSFIWTWLILLGVFIVDATFTLCRRLVRGDRVYEAHRTHAYQYASRMHRSHRKVTLAVLGVNVLWLYPLAFAVASGALSGLPGLLIAYIPLLGLALRYKAGSVEPVGSVSL